MKNRRGFTLIEVLIAILILAGATIVLYQSWGGSLMAVRKSRSYSTVSFLLQRKMVEFETSSKGKKVEELKKSESGDFGSDYPDYKWTIELQPFAVPPIMPPQASNNGQGEFAQMIVKLMTDYFEKAVREVKVSVIYQRSGKSQTYSLNTIYVDYTQGLPSGL